MQTSITLPCTRKRLIPIETPDFLHLLTTNAPPNPQNASVICQALSAASEDLSGHRARASTARSCLGSYPGPARASHQLREALPTRRIPREAAASRDTVSNILVLPARRNHQHARHYQIPLDAHPGVSRLALCCHLDTSTLE